LGDYTPKTTESSVGKQEEETLLIEEGEPSDFKNEQESIDSW
jgi:hypothetical protein